MSRRLELRDLARRFGGVAAVEALDLEVGAGEFVSLLGPSGCGKSTTLAMVAGFETPDHGAVRVDGRDVTHLPARRRGIGLVFQDYAVFTRLTVRENLAFGLDAAGTPRAERAARVAAAAARFDLEPLLDWRGAKLGMSEMQRVALARAVIVEPRILLLDEPMSNLDPAQRIALRGEIRRLQRGLRQSVLYVTHDQVEAMALSDRIAVMRAGRIEQVGDPDTIYRRPATRFVAEFIGDVPINFLPCEVEAAGAGAVARTALHYGLPVARGSRLGPAELAVRPHDVRVEAAAFPGAATAPVCFVERLGPEDVVHLEYGDRLLAAATRPGLAEPGIRLHVALDPAALHLVADDGRLLRLERAA